MIGDEWSVSRWMSQKLYTVSSKDPLVDAFELMHQHRIRHVPVLDHGRLVGIVSDRDVRQTLRLRGHGIDDTALFGDEVSQKRVADVMARKPITVSLESTVREAAELLCREKIGALPVLDDDKLVGIISAEDLLWAFVEHARHQHV